MRVAENTVKKMLLLSAKQTKLDSWKRARQNKCSPKTCISCLLAFFLYLLLICIDLSPAPQFCWCQEGEGALQYTMLYFSPLIADEMKSKRHLYPGREMVQVEGLWGVERNWKGCRFTSLDSDNLSPQHTHSHTHIGTSTSAAHKRLEKREKIRSSIG